MRDPKNGGRYRNVEYHHLSKHVKVDKYGKRYTDWGEAERAVQKKDFDYGKDAKPFVIYNARTWGRVSTIPLEMQNRAAMLTYSDRPLRQALLDDWRMGLSPQAKEVEEIDFHDELIDPEVDSELQVG